MSALKNLKISTKLILGFSLVIIALGIGVVSAYVSMGNINNTYGQIINVSFEKVINTKEINAAALEIANGGRGYILYGKDSYLQQIDQAYKDASTYLNEIASNSDESEKQLVETEQSNLDQYYKGIQDLITLLKAGKQEEGMKAAQAAAPILDSIKKVSNQIEQSEINKLNTAATQADNQAKSTQGLILMLLIVAVLIGVAAAILIIFLINKSLKETSTLVEKIAQGDLTSRANITSKDELGILMHQLNDTTESLEQMITSMKQSAEGVSKASDEIAAGNQDLSQRTQEQAAALEETSSAIEQLSSTVKLNADNALKANQMSSKTKDIVTEGNSVIKETIQAMEAVTQSSKKIAEIIDVVDEIAFQTNLLALNAAVEAARAGEQGRGFAVVAVEVRNLAQRSAEAAKEIQGLINDSVEKVHSGNNLVLKTGENLDKITESVQQMSDLISEISAASHQQASGIDEVNKAVVQMDQVTQQNASLVEEVAAASETMNAEAEELFNLAGQFKVTEERETRHTVTRNNHTPAKKSEHKQIHKAKKEKGELNFEDGFEKF